MITLTETILLSISVAITTGLFAWSIAEILNKYTNTP